MDLIMNIAIGGNMGGAYPDSFEYEMLVDYVRVYQGDWSAAMAGDGAGPYVAAAEGVLALASDDYADQANTDWFPWGSAQYQGLVDGAHTYNNVDYIGIEPAAPIDLSGQDTVHLTIMRTNPDADLIFKLVNVNRDQVGSIYRLVVEANEWLVTFPKSEFINLNTQRTFTRSSSQANGAASNETLYVKELYERFNFSGRRWTLKLTCTTTRVLSHSRATSRRSTWAQIFLQRLLGHGRV